MSDSISQSIVVMGDTVLKYETANTSVYLDKISSMSDVRRIGSGAFMDCSSLVSMDLPKNIREIGAEAFRRCTSLSLFSMYAGKDVVLEGRIFEGTYKIRKFVFKDVCVSRDDFEMIRYQSMTADNRVYTSLTFPEKYLPENFEQAVGKRPAVYVPDNCTSLLMRMDRGANYTIGDVNRTDEFCNRMMVGESGNITVEEQEVSEIIKKGIVLEIPSSIEAKIHEAQKKKSIRMVFDKVMVFSFDSHLIKEEGNNIVFDLTVWLDQIFIPSVRSIQMDGNTYYLYSRLYLSIDKDVPLIPQDVAIFKGTKRLYDPEEGMRVFAKFRLLEML